MSEPVLRLPHRLSANKKAPVEAGAVSECMPENLNAAKRATARPGAGVGSPALPEKASPPVAQNAMALYWPVAGWMA
jgi:hypothetical protein